MLLTYSGRHARRPLVLESIPEAADRRARALRALAEVPALVAIGRCETAAEDAARAFAEQMQLPDQIAIPGPGVHIVNPDVRPGRMRSSRGGGALAAAAYEATPATAPPDVLMWLSHQQGRCALLCGRVETARRWLGEAAGPLRGAQHRRPAPARALRPRHRPCAPRRCRRRGRGRARAGPAAAVPVRTVRAGARTRRGRWSSPVISLEPVTCCAPRPTSPRPAATASPRRGSSTTSPGSAIPASVADRLAELAGQCEGGLVAAYAAHAAARRVAGRPQPLADVSDRFELMGAMLLAAEAATEAAQAFQRAGDRRAAAALGVRASTLAGAVRRGAHAWPDRSGRGGSTHPTRARHRHPRRAG